MSNGSRIALSITVISVKTKGNRVFPVPFIIIRNANPIKIIGEGPKFICIYNTASFIIASGVFIKVKINLGKINAIEKQ
jgi:hypothetical protein